MRCFLMAALCFGTGAAADTAWAQFEIGDCAPLAEMHERLAAEKGQVYMAYTEVLTISQETAQEVPVPQYYYAQTPDRRNREWTLLTEGICADGREGVRVSLKGTDAEFYNFQQDITVKVVPNVQGAVHSATVMPVQAYELQHAYAACRALEREPNDWSCGGTVEVIANQAQKKGRVPFFRGTVTLNNHSDVPMQLLLSFNPKNMNFGKYDIDVLTGKMEIVNFGDAGRVSKYAKALLEQARTGQSK
ncbi:MAG: hypothetical protein RIC38_08280 [Chromatocurvus sp.]